MNVKADIGQWRAAKLMSQTSTVVVVNGVFVNGFIPFEPVYFFKPISGWGSLVRQYPGNFVAYCAGTNEVVSASLVGHVHGLKQHAQCYALNSREA